MVGAGTREGRVGSLGQGLNLKAGGSIELTKMTGIKPTFQGVAFPTDEEILEESLDNTNNGTRGGGGGYCPTNGAGNGTGTDRVGDEGAGDPHTTRGDGPRGPRVPDKPGGGMVQMSTRGMVGNPPPWS